VDDTGAGDAFGSGFVYGRIKGWSLADSLKAGAANGASEVMKIGVKEGLLSESELDKWMKKELRLVEEKVRT
jgi:sugar/nucleoside kinase (ribokinase family)